MHTCRTFQAMLFALAAAGLATPACADLPLPQPVHQGDVTYISGGFGQDEQHALEASAKNYNLAITNAIKTGAFTSGTNLTIRAANGKPVLDVSNTGPLFYAKLPPGQYTIRAENGPETRLRQVTVAAGKPADLHLIWHQMG